MHRRLTGLSAHVVLRPAACCAGVLIGSVLLWPGPVHAQESSGSQPAAGEQVAPQPPPRSPSLERLLRPRGPLTEAPSRNLPGGKDREAWETAFDRRRRELAQLEARIDATQEELRANAGSDWNYSPTGGGQGVDPEVQKLRARLKRDRQSRDAARARLKELEVEAALAGVPEEWTRP